VSREGLKDSLPASAKGSHKLVLPYEVHRRRLPIVASWKLRLYEVAMVLGIPTISFALRHCRYRVRSVRQNDAVYVFERLHLAIAFNGSAHLFRSGVTRKGHGCFDAVRFACSATSARAAHILVRGIGATAD